MDEHVINVLIDLAGTPGGNILIGETAGTDILICDSRTERERKLDALAAEMDRRMAALEARIIKCERDRPKVLRLWEEAGMIGQSKTPAG